MVSFVAIEETLPPEWCEIIDLFVDFWKCVTILGAGFVKVFVIDAHAPAPGRFFYHDWVGQPSLVFDFPQDACGEQFFDLLLHRLIFS
ncbi:hypothetical protein HanXRQr2_Chr14g0655701 [Helianthus annuus]|uniref:Uncharacterized protein n=1 Tax=Helianthus annuus TaxID=4232 RepID=A0A9K3EA86_HELAN|nr:hypothetical protein HanXRQr2_Chr14g0655701 [Helianthus annuus]